VTGVEPSPLPELDRGALSLADLAYLEEPPGAPPVERVSAAIRAYLWAVANAHPWPPNPDLTAYPSLNEYRAARAADRSTR